MTKVPSTPKTAANDNFDFECNESLYFSGALGRSCYQMWYKWRVITNSLDAFESRLSYRVNKWTNAQFSRICRKTIKAELLQYYWKEI